MSMNNLSIVVNDELMELNEWFLSNKLTLNIDKTCYSVSVLKKHLAISKLIWKLKYH